MHGMFDVPCHDVMSLLIYSLPFYTHIHARTHLSPLILYTDKRKAIGTIGTRESANATCIMQASFLHGRYYSVEGCGILSPYWGPSHIPIKCITMWYRKVSSLRECMLKHSYLLLHYSDVIMGTIASQITSLTIVYSIVFIAAWIHFFQKIHKRFVLDSFRNR